MREIRMATAQHKVKEAPPFFLLAINHTDIHHTIIKVMAIQTQDSCFAGYQGVSLSASSTTETTSERSRADEGGLATAREPGVMAGDVSSVKQTVNLNQLRLQ